MHIERRDYEPPRVEVLGSLFDLTWKSGLQSDSSTQNPTRGLTS